MRVVDKFAKRMKTPLCVKYQKLVCKPHEFIDKYQYNKWNNLDDYKKIVCIWRYTRML